MLSVCLSLVDHTDNYHQGGLDRWSCGAKIDQSHATILSQSLEKPWIFFFLGGGGGGD